MRRLIMSASFIRGSAALAVGVAALAWNTVALAQSSPNNNNVIIPPAQPAPAQPAPAQQQAPAPAPAPAPAAPQAAPQQSTVVTQPAAQPVQTTSAPVVVQPSGRTSSETVSGQYGPNRTLLTSGLLIFGIPYISSVIVAGSSSHSGDNHLFVPLAGPWIDMGDRGGCPPSSTACDNETTNKVLLGADGILQAVGAFEIIGAFAFPETRTVTTVPATAYTPALTLTPSKVGRNGYGFSAFAEF
jgi:hypothetical protein